MSLFGKKENAELKWGAIESKVTKTVREILERALSDTETVLARLKSSFDLQAYIIKLREEIETLRIEKGRKDEGLKRSGKKSTSTRQSEKQRSQ
jgi:hypothetical protein